MNVNGKAVALPWFILTATVNSLAREESEVTLVLLCTLPSPTSLISRISMKTFKSLLGAWLIAFSMPALAEQFIVVGVSDGDTVKVLSSDQHEMKCRLWGIDAPEGQGQSFGQKSKQSLSDLIYRRSVEVQVVAQDRYGRSVCRISLNGRDINKEQIAAGMAWMYRQYTSDPLYAQAESSARAKQLGLWAEANPTPPWEFRKAGRGAGAATGHQKQHRTSGGEHELQDLKVLADRIQKMDFKASFE